MSPCGGRLCRLSIRRPDEGAARPIFIASIQNRRTVS